MRLTLLAVGWCALALGLGLFVVCTVLGSDRLQRLGLVYIISGLGIVGVRKWVARRPEQRH